MLNTICCFAIFNSINNKNRIMSTTKFKGQPVKIAGEFIKKAQQLLIFHW